MEAIGLFQLENLILSRSPMTFIDVRTGESETSPPEPVGRYLKAALRLKPEDVRKHLQDAEKDKPVLLVSEDESESSAVGRDLEAAGFTNVYIIAGGVAGLVSEL